MKYLIGLTLFLSLSLFAAEPSEALIKSCNDCHGENGISQEADVPTIAGASETYLLDSLTFYKSAERIAIESKYRHGDLTRASTNMQKISQALSDDEINQVAAYYAKQQFIATKQKFDANLASKGKKIHDMHCTKCHEEGGSSADDDAGILAGQPMAFLRDTFKLYRSGQRSMEDKMKVKIDKLSDDDIEALLNFYASQQ